MITKTIIVFLIYVSFIFPQPETKNPNVELPDFVITGKDIISIRRVDKMKPDFIPTITGEFLKPMFKPEDLEIAQISNPIEGDMKLLDSADYHNGIITLNAGRYTLPGGEINYAFPIERGILHGILTGDNQIEYLDYSDRVTYSGELDFNYSLSNANEFLPGTKFSIGGKHTVNKYNFFGSITPERKRTLNAGNAYLDIQNLYGKKFIFDIELAGDFTYLDTENFNESILNTNLFGKYNLDDFALLIKADYQKQYLTTDSLGNPKPDYWFLRPAIAFKIVNKFIASAGFTFSGSGSDYMHNIYASLSAEVSKNFVILGEYQPVGEFVTSGYLLKENFYFNPQSYSSIFVKKKNMLNITMVYEYDKYFQIDGGLRYFKTGNLPYYTNPDTSGIFELAFADAKTFVLFTNLLFHLGPSGIFYGSIELSDVENSEGNRVPYYPAVRGTLSYGYEFNTELMAKLSLEYLSKRFVNIENTNSVKSLFNLGLLLEYKFWNNLLLSLELENIFGVKYYLWEGYQEKPFDITLGASLFFN